jgi:peptide deformylase
MIGTYEEIPEEIPEENRLELKLRKEVEQVECDEIIEEEASGFIPIAQAMIEFVAKNGGVGLSAPQVGINKKLIVWQGKNDTFHIGFNPKFYSKGKSINTIESCLSYPEEEYFVPGRKKYIQAVYYALNQGGKLVKITRSMRDDEAIIYQHEVDHINGKTIAMTGKRL